MYLKSLKINEALNRKGGMAIQYGSLGFLYETRKNMSAACDSWKKSMALFEEMGVPDTARVLERKIVEAGCP